MHRRESVLHLWRPVLNIVTISLLMVSAVMAQNSSLSPQHQAELTRLNGELRIGTEFFLNRTETRETVEKHFRLMHENGLTLVRIFVIWDDIEREPGKWNFEGYDWIYQAAASNGIKIAATLCPEDPPGWKDRTPFYHNRTNLNNPELRKEAAIYIDKVVGRYKNHPAQGVWLLMNEPTKYDTEPATFRAFGDWLQAKYGTTAELNKYWFRPLQNFADVNLTAPQLEFYWTDYRELIDWKNFNVDNLIDQLIWVKQQVEAVDPIHPTHFNVTEPTGDAVGQDVWKEKRIPDILGVTMHAAWAFPGSTPESEYGERYAYRLDLIADASRSLPAKPFWVTELQSGPTLYTGQFSLTTTPGDLTRWLWDSYGAGSRAVIFWLWQPRVEGTEAGEWGLVSLDGTPTNRLPAVKEVADTLKRNPWLNEARPQDAKVAILYDRQAAIINALDGRGQKRGEEVSQALLGCYLALHRAHVPTQFVDIDQLKSGALGRFNVLYLPDAYAIDDASIAALKEYVRNGGTLWADGLTAWKHETGAIRPTIPGGLTDLIGAEASDVYPVQPDEPYSVTDQKELGGELWRLPLQIKGAEVVLRDHDGNLFALRHQFGKGTVYYSPSVATLAYARRMSPIVQNWIVQPAKERSAALPVQFKEGSHKVLFRGLVLTSGTAAILSNWGETQRVSVSFHGQCSVINVVSGEPVPTKYEGGESIATLTMQAGSVAVLKAEVSKAR